MEPIKDHNDIIRGFEVKVFHYALIIAFVFRFLRLVHEYLVESPPPVILVGVLNIIVISLIFLFYRRHYLLGLTVFYFQILLTSVLTWNNAGGWNGSVPYVLLVALVAIIITSYGLFQVVSLFLYGLVIILFAYTGVLSSFSETNDNYSSLSSEIDFFVSTVLLVSITLYLKNSFFTFRESVELNNERLMESSKTLTHQNQKLHEQQAELNSVRNNLETITSSKINEVQRKTETLNEYAFINTHHVRGPLARVLGLISLIELENPNQKTSDAIALIKQEAQEMDVIIAKINDAIGR